MDAQQFRQRYKKLAGERSVMNDVMNEIMFLTLAGALCHKRGIRVETQTLRDLRIHSLIVQPSRTGKGVSLGILNRASEFAGISMTDEIQFTDAGLVGTIDEKVYDSNRQKGLTEVDPEYEDPTIVGDLGVYDVISFSEAKQMIKLSAYSDDKLEILQSIMDTPGHIKKKLGNGKPVEYDSNASIISTTYFLGDFERIFLEQGIFQRMLVYVRRFDIKERKELNSLLIKGSPISNVNFDKKLESYAVSLRKKVEKTPENAILRLDTSAQTFIDKKISQWTDEIENEFQGSELEVMLSYATASINLFIKIAAIGAVLNNSDKITRKEANFAYHYIARYMKSIKNEVLTKVSVIDDKTIALKALSFINHESKKDNSGNYIDGPTMEEVKNAVKEKFYGVSSNRVNKVIRDMVAAQEIKYLNPVAPVKKVVRIEK